jgi:serine-type D-Ala-D-Ala carboxypeptidase/endopeptidase (penicillin-binding protein 4)
MSQEFSWDRIINILPTGGTGTLNNFYKPLQHKIFAKTGTLSGQVALSGYLITKKNRKLIFSVLVNNHQTSAVTVRRAVEAFLMNLHAIY